MQTDFYLKRSLARRELGARLHRRARPVTALASIVHLSMIALCVACFGPGCSPRSSSQPEPSAGSWRPIVLDSVSTFGSAPPPVPGTARWNAEKAELLDFQARRTAHVRDVIHYWDARATIRWNEIARELVAKHRTSAPMASRVYALLSVAQHDALVATWQEKYFFHRVSPRLEIGSLRALTSEADEPAYPCGHAATAGASSSVLQHLYPDESNYLIEKTREHEESRLWAGASYRSAVTAGDALGRRVAARVTERADEDRAASAADGSFALVAPHQWRSAADDIAELPNWGQVKPWLTDPHPFVVPPAPSFDSPDFRAALAEVKRKSDALTPEQARVAALWADGPGSYTPAGRWNKIAADLCRKHALNEVRTARVFALLNMAMMDAGIACWETKYRFLVARPSQLDSTIRTPVGLPNFPSYTSAHAAFSGAGASVLAYLFPSDAPALRAKATEAALSRTYGGIHYAFDGTFGLLQGQAVARLAILRGKSDGAP